MAVDISDRVIVRLFMGCPVASDLKLQLSESHQWKEAKITRTEFSEELVESHFQNKIYIGLYIDHSELTLKEIEKLERRIIDTIIKYCPTYQREKLKPVVFPQVFIA